MRKNRVTLQLDLVLAAVLAVASGCSNSEAPGLTGGESSACAGKEAQPLDATWTVSVGGLERKANVHVPASYDPSKPTPVVLNFHGLGSNATEQNVLAHTNDKADEAGFIAVHPEGTGSPDQSWNAGACCDPAVASGVDDVAFVRALLDRLESQLCVDEKRVFSAGMSNGAFMTQRLACELTDRIAAVAPVAGVMILPACTPSRPIALLEFHGTMDPLVPYDGSTQYGFPPVEAQWADWATRDGCTDEPQVTFLQGDTTCRAHQQCASGVEVVLCTVDGGGHTWPGGFPVPQLGKTTNEISATDAMWDFFQRHPLP